MYILVNALKNLRRNIGRNILLSIIIFILILSTTVGLVINSTTKGIITDYKNRFGSNVTLSVDFDKLKSQTAPDANGFMTFPTAPEIKSEQYVAFADSKQLKSYDINMETGIVFESLKAIDEESNKGMGNNIGEGASEFIAPTAKLLGYNNAENIPDFASGLRKIDEGKIYNAKDECIVSMDFAKLNQLKIGDTFVIKDSVSKKNLTLKVSGIYADATKAKETVPNGSFSLSGSSGNRRNEIFVGLATMSENFDVAGLIVNAEYILKSPDLVKDFESELREKGLPEEYNVDTDQQSYNKIVAPVVGLSNISLTFVWIILAIGSLILVFITTMTIRERKYEIGVLRAMGLKKSKVGLMLITEMFTITLICLGLGLGLGSAISQPIANSLIAEQVKVAENTNQNDMQFNSSISMGEVGADSNVEALSEINVSLNTEAAIQIILVAFVLALLSSASGVIFITKYEPMKILSERN